MGACRTDELSEGTRAFSEGPWGVQQTGAMMSAAGQRTAGSEWERGEGWGGSLDRDAKESWAAGQAERGASE